MKPNLNLVSKTLMSALAGAALLASPIAASAQTHGGGHSGGGGFHGGGGGFHGGSSFHGGGFRGGQAFHGGGYRGGYYHGGYGYGGYALGGFGLGLALGAASAPWGYYGPGDYYDYPDYGPSYGYAAPPPAAAPAACGNWSWNPSRGAYDWIPC